MEIDSITWRTPNYSKRSGAVDSIVIHTGEGTRKSDLETLTSRAAKVSSNFYVDRAGKVYQLANTAFATWHAGRCSYAGRTDWNDRSIGIETEHRRGQDWPEVQKAALHELCRLLISIYRIKEEMIVAHRWVAVPRYPWPRKVDPSDWSNRELRAWIASLYGRPEPDIRDYKVRRSVLPWAVVRKEPSTSAPKIGTLLPGEPFPGKLIDFGYPHKGDPRWVHRISELGGGYVWYGLVDVLL